MKQPNPPKKKTLSGKSRKVSGSVPGRKRGNASGRQEDAVKAVSGLDELRAKSNELQRKSEGLHEPIEKVHGKATSRRGKITERKPALIPDSQFLEEEDEALAEKSARGSPFPIVGIGASAGGFEALSDFLKFLPADTGMAFVLVQHLDPKHKSQLTELLGRNASVPVVEAKDNVEVAPDRVYVIPANARITISDGRLRVSPRKENELPPMPVDAFFRSLAAEQQDRAIGIVLSGTGTDGTLGIEAIKGEGGITFAQHESSAKYYGMPGSAINSGSVDLF
jgi:two-component system CheB/CheR fusion protein